MPGSNNKPINVLIADDQKDILTSAALLLKSEDIECTLCDSVSAVYEQIKQKEFDVLLLDMNFSQDTTSGSEGLSLIKTISQSDCDASIVAMTAWATVDIAVESMKLGANDFVTKPWENERLLSIIRTQTALKRSLQKQFRLANENALLNAEMKSEIIAESSPMLATMEVIKQVAPSDARILIMGENGTGKSMIARECHALSSRADGPFISVNMGGLADNLFESEIFGHEKGAFTGAIEQRVGRYELADGGTLFLDEIANLGEKQQATLLRLLETGEYERLGSSRTRRSDVRIICATNGDIPKKVSEGSFREDLLYRINTISLIVPPVRERVEDILPLANQFLGKYKLRYNRQGLKLTESCQSALKKYQWPGNVRELDHTIERGVLLSKGDEVDVKSLGLDTLDLSSVPEFAKMTLDQAEAYLLNLAVQRHEKQPDLAAEVLGISRSALYRKLKKHNIDPQCI